MNLIEVDILCTEDATDNLKLNVKKRYIEGLLAIATIFLAFLSNTENNLFYLFFCAFIVFSLVLFTFMNFERKTADTRIIWNVVYIFISIFLAISFSSIFSYLFYVKTLHDNTYSFLFEVVFSTISIYILMVLLNGVDKDIIESYHALTTNEHRFRTIGQWIKVSAIISIAFSIFYIIGHYIILGFVLGESATHSPDYIIQNANVIINNSTVTVK